MNKIIIVLGFLISLNVSAIRPHESGGANICLDKTTKQWVLLDLFAPGISSVKFNVRFDALDLSNRVFTAKKSLVITSFQADLEQAYKNEGDPVYMIIHRFFKIFDRVYLVENETFYPLNVDFRSTEYCDLETLRSAALLRNDGLFVISKDDIDRLSDFSLKGLVFHEVFRALQLYAFSNELSNEDVSYMTWHMTHQGVRGIRYFSADIRNKLRKVSTLYPKERRDSMLETYLDHQNGLTPDEMDKLFRELFMAEAFLGTTNRLDRILNGESHIDRLNLKFKQFMEVH